MENKTKFIELFRMHYKEANWWNPFSWFNRNVRAIEMYDEMTDNHRLKTILFEEQTEFNLRLNNHPPYYSADTMTTNHPWQHKSKFGSLVMVVNIMRIIIPGDELNQMHEWIHEHGNGWILHYQL